MRLYQFNDSEEQFSLLRIAEETDFTDEEFDRLANLNVGEGMTFDDEVVDYVGPPAAHRPLRLAARRADDVLSAIPARGHVYGALLVARGPLV